MVRRAGLPEAQTSTVGVPSIEGGLPSAAVKVYDDLARAAGQIGQALQPMVDNETEDRARKAVSEGKFDRTQGWTRQDELYNRVVDAGVIANGMNDLERIIGEVELKHHGDLNVEEYAKDMAAARTTYLQDMDSRYGIPLGQEWDQRAIRSSQRISEMATTRAVKRGVEGMNARQDLLIQQLSGASRTDDHETSNRIEELNGLLQARVANREDGLTQEEADGVMLNTLSKIEANYIGDQALQSYVDSGMTDEAYTASLALIDKAIADPKLSLDRTERASYLGAARTALNSARSEKMREERELEAKIREAQRDASTDLGIMLPDARQRASAGSPINPDEIGELRRLAVASGKPRNLAAVEQLERTVATQQGMRGLSIPQQERKVQELRVAAAQGDPEAARQLDAAEAVATAARKAAESDPATYAALTERREAPQIDWTKPATIADGMTARFHEAEVAAGNLGVGVKYFSPADRAQLKAITDKGGANALVVATSIVEAANSAGVDPLAVLDEIAGGGAPLLATSGALIAQGVPVEVAGKIMAGKAVMGSEFVKDKMPKQATQASAQRTVLGPQLSRLPLPMVDAITRSADAYYAAELVESGGQPDGGESKAYERAMRAVMGEWKDETGKTFGGQVSMRNTTVMAPPWIEKGKFESVIGGLTKDEVLRSLSQDQLYPTLGVFRGRDATIADYRSARLVDAGAGRYYIAPDPNKENDNIYDRSGKIVVLDLNVIREPLQARYPQSVR